MCHFMIHNRPCKIKSKHHEYCHVHRPSEKLLKKLKSQKDELTILNQRLSEANRKLKIIDEADRIKYELSVIAPDCSFRQAIQDPMNKDIIERIFRAPHQKCMGIYDEILNKRNMLTHRYTARNWIEPIKKTNHGRSVQQLVNSIKAHTLLRKV